MKKLTYVTGNYGKYLHVKDLFSKNKVDVEFLKHDFDELDINDIEKISKSKVLEAYNILKSPCFVIDTGFYIEDYPKNYEVLEGKIYEPLTTGKYLCVEPVLNKNKEIMKIRMSFSETGEYTIKVNGFFFSMQEIGSAWNEDFYTYKILVK